MERIAEPEIMDCPERARAYAEAHFSEVNAAFAGRLLELAGDLDSARALDLGTGPGDIPFRLVRQRPGWRIAGLDASLPMLRLARAARTDASGLTQVDFVLGDAKCTPFPSDTFDVILSNSILHHVSDTIAFWKEAARVAKSGALLFARDLMRPESCEAARALVETHAAGEHALLREDFFDSLLASYSTEEVEAQLYAAGVARFEVWAISDRHLEVFAVL